ncbi:MAG: carboxypeptidase M32 [Paracoccus sp. (in: a-proteobacteria)]|nr:carboxypeptidase M32 [Paracoccus sp. (in: a-proteobacteria)]
MSAFDALMEHQSTTEALSSIAERLGWDQETVMPRGATEQRADEMAAIEAVLHERRADPRVGEWLDLAAGEAEDDEDRRMLELIGRDYRRATRIPARLAAELARATSLAQGIWAEARGNDDVGAFLPSLAEILMLKREEAGHLADSSAGAGALYDALLDDYEPGARADDISRLFDAMRPRLVRLRDDVMGAARQPETLRGHFPQETQLRLARQCATAFGYDWSRGRLDMAVHPFSSGRWQDSRITTRVVETDPFNCLYSTMHEVGHSSYELGIDSDYAFTILGRGVSLGVHESQSRIYENQIGRSRAFTGWLFERMSDAFNGLSVADADAFYGAVNRVSPGYIRTEADEVQYNLHVMMRFDLERDLIAGKIEPEHLEEAWNARFLADFGVAVNKPSNGVLQDVHWAVGLFGYFPTYALGNVYAGCLHQAMRAALPDLDTALSEGDASPAVEWLREQVQRHGALLPARELIEAASGMEVGPEPLLAYLEEKFGGIYGL